MNTPVKISALIITLNGERLLEQCLSSLSFCDQILIVDSFSTDKTEEIAKKFNTFFVKNKWPGNNKQIEFGIKWFQNNSPTDWILMLDCDEIVSSELQRNIISAISNPDDSTAFSMPRRTWYYDRFLRYGGSYPDRLFRLFRNGGITLKNSGAHQKFVPTGKFGILKGDLLHYTYTNFFNQIEKLNDYARRGALDLEAHGIKGGLFKAICHGLWRFFDLYIKRLGLLDGKAGFLMAVHTSFYTFMKYIRINEGTWGAPYSNY